VLSLETAYLRVKRSREHMADVRGLCEAFIQTYREATIIEQPSCEVVIPQGGAAQVVGVDTSNVPPPPTMIAVRVGEAVYNLRAALDYLIAILSRLDSPDVTKDRRTQFPIEHQPKKFQSRRNNWLIGVSDNHVAVIERLQPYNGCDWTQRLAALSNLDKHNALIRVEPDMLMSYEIRTEPSTEPGSIPFTMKVKFQPTIRIVLGGMLPIVETLEALALNVADVLDSFQAEFERGHD
jgi:hypothetical protein